MALIQLDCFFCAHLFRCDYTEISCQIQFPFHHTAALFRQYKCLCFFIIMKIKILLKPWPEFFYFILIFLKVQCHLVEHFLWKCCGTDENTVLFYHPHKACASRSSHILHTHRCYSPAYFQKFPYAPKPVNSPAKPFPSP